MSEDSISASVICLSLRARLCSLSIMLGGVWPVTAVHVHVHIEPSCLSEPSSVVTLWGLLGSGSWALEPHWEGPTVLQTPVYAASLVHDRFCCNKMSWSISVKWCWGGHKISMCWSGCCYKHQIYIHQIYTWGITMPDTGWSFIAFSRLFSFMSWKCGYGFTLIISALGLQTPAQCELVVGGEPQCWSEGHCLLVDDSFLHTVSHNG